VLLKSKETAWKAEAWASVRVRLGARKTSPTVQYFGGSFEVGEGAMRLSAAMLSRDVAGDDDDGDAALRYGRAHGDGEDALHLAGLGNDGAVVALVFEELLGAGPDGVGDAVEGVAGQTPEAFDAVGNQRVNENFRNIGH
jgi:hypothetical protein